MHGELAELQVKADADVAYEAGCYKLHRLRHFLVV